MKYDYIVHLEAVTDANKDLFVDITYYLKRCYYGGQIFFQYDMPSGKIDQEEIERRLKQMGESFAKYLAKVITEKNLDEVEVYKKANMDRRLYSKIKNEKTCPDETTVFSLAVALELSLDEVKTFMGKAGFHLTNNDKRDVLMTYFFERKIYDIQKINEVLYAYDCELLYC